MNVYNAFKNIVNECSFDIFALFLSNTIKECKKRNIEDMVDIAKLLLEDIDNG